MTSIRDEAFQERPTRIARRFLEKKDPSNPTTTPEPTERTGHDLLLQYLSRTIELIEQLRRKQSAEPADLQEEIRTSLGSVLHEIEGLRTDHKTLNHRVAQIQNTPPRILHPLTLLCILAGVGVGLLGGTMFDPSPPSPTVPVTSPKTPDSVVSTLPNRLTSLEQSLESILSDLTEIRVRLEDAGTTDEANRSENRRLVQRVEKALETLHAAQPLRSPTPSQSPPPSSSPLPAKATQQEAQKSPTTELAQLDLNQFQKDLNRLFANLDGQPHLRFRRIRGLASGRMIAVAADEMSPTGEILRLIEAQECRIRIEVHNRRIVFEFRNCRLITPSAKPTPLSTLQLPSYGIDLFDIDPIPWIQVLGPTVNWTK